MKKVVLLTSILIGALPQAFNQAFNTLNINDVEMRVFSNGKIGNDLSLGTPGFVVPAGSGASPMGYAGLWMAGSSTDNQLKLAAQLYGSGSDFFPGPLTIDGSATISDQVSLAYDMVLRIDKSQVDQHVLWYNCLNEPSCDIATLFPNGYTVPQAFINWPANGDVNAGQALYLAPYVDANGDGYYDPYAGDYPCIRGNQALFTIFNDKLAPHTESGGGQIGVEIHMMPFAYNSAGPALDQTVFVHYTVINRASQTLTDFRIGNFADLDIGCPDDDFIGTDVGRNLVYAYNWDDNDETCQGGSSIGYGPQPPAFGMTILKGPYLDADGADNISDPATPAFNGLNFNDGIIDNERFGISGSQHFYRQGNSALTDPNTPFHFRNYLHSVWKDGTPLSYGYGYSTDPGVTPSLFSFPNSTDPLGVGTNGVPQVDWSENVPTPASPDRRGLAIMGPITLEPGAIHNFLIAHVYARAGSGGASASVPALQQRVDSVIAFAEAQGLLADELGCADAFTGLTHYAKPRTDLSLFPIPATDQLSVVTNGIAAGSVIEIYDARGQLIMTQSVIGATMVVDVRKLNAGLYVVRCAQQDAVHIGRFVKE